MKGLRAIELLTVLGSIPISSGLIFTTRMMVPNTTVEMNMDAPIKALLRKKITMRLRLDTVKITMANTGGGKKTLLLKKDSPQDQLNLVLLQTCISCEDIRGAIANGKESDASNAGRQPHLLREEVERGHKEVICL